MKLAWATDTHFNFIDDELTVKEFAYTAMKGGTQGLVFTGDISTAHSLVGHLAYVENIVNMPIYVVLGNHDFYGSSIVDVRKTMHELTNMSKYIRYLSVVPYVQLSPTTFLVGHDCWYDARNGNERDNTFVLSDWLLIKEFAPFSGGQYYVIANKDVKNRHEIVLQARVLADEGATHVANGIKAAMKHNVKNIIVTMHAPPFPEAHVHNGTIGNTNAQPWFTSKVCGDMLLRASRAYKNVNFIVLCGHTHGTCSVQVTKNLVVHVGGAEYGHPVETIRYIEVE